MDHTTEESISNNLEKTLQEKVGVRKGRDWKSHGQGIFEVYDRSLLPRIKEAVQKADPYLAITAMTLCPDGWTLVNFDRID